MMDAFDIAMAEQSEQGSQRWVDVRAGRFTSSEMHRLMASGSRLMTDAELKARPKTGIGSKSKYIEDETCLSADTETYIREKVAETLTQEAKPNIRSHATEHGEMWEPYAAEYFAKRMGFTYDIVSFVPFGDHAGGSPDRFIITDHSGLEIKCPYNPANQIKYLELTDQWDLKREFPEHYWQIQSNMLFTDRPKWHFVAFDPRMKDDRHKIAHLDVKQIPEEADLIIKKLETAIKKKLEMIQTLEKIIEINSR